MKENILAALFVLALVAFVGLSFVSCHRGIQADAACRALGYDAGEFVAYGVPDRCLTYTARPQEAPSHE